MKHPEFRKRAEAVLMEMQKLHAECVEDMIKSDASHVDAGYLVELGQFGGACMLVEDIVCRPAVDEPQQQEQTVIIRP